MRFANENSSFDNEAASWSKLGYSNRMQPRTKNSGLRLAKPFVPSSSESTRDPLKEIRTKSASSDSISPHKSLGMSPKSDSSEEPSLISTLVIPTCEVCIVSSEQGVDFELTQ